MFTFGQALLVVGRADVVRPRRAADRCADPDRAARHVGDALAERVVEVADFLGREDVLQVDVVVEVRIVEVGVLVVDEARVVGRRSVAERGDVVAVEQVGVEFRVLAEPLRRAQVRLRALVAVVDRVVAGSRRAAVLAAIGSRLHSDRAAEQAGDVGAVRRILEVIGVRAVAVRAEVAVHEVVALRDRRTRAAAEIVGCRPALVAPDRRGLVVLHAREDVQSTEVEAVGECHGLVGAAAVLREADASVEVGAVELLLQDDVDDAGDRVRAVQRRLAARQDVDPLDQRHRYAADAREGVGAVVERRVVRHGQPVDQVLHVAGREAEHRQGLRALREASRELRALRGTGRECALLQRIGDRRETTHLQVFGRDGRERRGGLFLWHRDQRAGDDDLLERLDGRGLGALLRLQRARQDERRQRSVKAMFKFHAWSPCLGHCSRWPGRGRIYSPENQRHNLPCQGDMKNMHNTNLPVPRRERTLPAWPALGAEHRTAV